VGASTSHNPKGLQGLYRGKLYLLTFYLKPEGKGHLEDINIDENTSEFMLKAWGHAVA
jgi:hypothetical protein